MEQVQDVCHICGLPSERGRCAICQFSLCKAVQHGVGARFRIAIETFPRLSSRVRFVRGFYLMVNRLRCNIPVGLGVKLLTPKPEIEKDLNLTLQCFRCWETLSRSERIATVIAADGSYPISVH